MKTIIFALALSSLFSFYNVEATARLLLQEAQGAPDQQLDQLCQKTENPAECLATFKPVVSGPVEVHSLLQTGLKVLEDKTNKAISDAENIKSENPGSDAAQATDYALYAYRNVVNGTKAASEAVANRDYVKLHEELNTEVVSIEEIGADEKFPLAEVNAGLLVVAKNNYDLLMNVVKPSLPETPLAAEDAVEEEAVAEEAAEETASASGEAAPSGEPAPGGTEQVGEETSSASGETAPDEDSLNESVEAAPGETELVVEETSTASGEAAPAEAEVVVYH